MRLLSCLRRRLLLPQPMPLRMIPHPYLHLSNAPRAQGIEPLWIMVVSEARHSDLLAKVACPRTVGPYLLRP